MATALPTGGEISTALVREHLYTFDKEAFVDKLSTASQNGCAAAYGTRLLRSNYFGPMVRVRRNSDNVEQDFYGDVFGKLGTRIYATGTSFASWLGGATGFVIMMYDQSGNVRNIGQATNANQPTISTSGITYSGTQWLQVTNTQIPTAAMTSNSSGGLVASASSELFSGGWDAWNAFDFNSGTGWHNSTSSYVVGNGLYTGGFTTTDINNGVHRGEWLQIQLASAIKLNSFSITPRTTYASERSPREFVILGSNNGASWTVVHQEFNINNWTSASKIFTVITSNVQSYSYYRIITKRIGNSDSGMTTSDTVQIMEWILNPTSVPLTAGNDTYTYYATWNCTNNSSNGVICEQNTSSLTGSRRGSLICVGAGLKYGFNGESNDIHDLVPFVLNIQRRTVMMCNHNLSSGNIEIYDEGVLYKGTSTVPANLNLGSDIFIIGRKSNGAEYFIGNINEVIVTNITALEKEALLYFAPILLTKPKEPFPRPKKAITFFPAIDNSTPLNHGGRTVTNLNLDLINVSHGSGVSDWYGYTQGTSGNRPIYNSRGGFTNEMGYVNFDRASSQHLTGGSRTLNIATNGGLTIVCLIKFTGTVGSFERIIDFGNGQANSNILFSRSGTTSTIYLDSFNSTTIVGTLTATNAIVQEEWAMFAFRYNASNRFAELMKNGVTLSSATFGTALADRTITTAYVGRSHWADAYLNAHMGGLYVFDRYLSSSEMEALSNSLYLYSLPNIPRHISELTNVYSNTETSPIFVPSRTGYSAFYNGRSDCFTDIQDIPHPPISYCFWFYQTTSSLSTIVGMCNHSKNGNGIQVDYPTATNQLTVYAALPTAWSRIDIANVLVNTWYHIVVTLNSNYQVQVYLNGVYQNQMTGTGLPPSRSRFVLGASGDGNRGYQGFIHDFRIYDYILRGDEISLIYDGVTMNQNALQPTSNYLVNIRNWYSIMQLGTNGPSFTGTFTAAASGNDPNVQYRLLNATASVNNYVYHNQRIQDYRSFTCSFEIYTTDLGGSGGGGDQMYFFVGGTSLPTWAGAYNNSYYLDFQVFNANADARRGVALFRSGTNVAQSDYTQYINLARWVPVTITYQRSGSEAIWLVNVGENTIINYVDTANETWRSNSGTYWGIGGWTGSALMSAYIRRVELTYIPDASGQLVKGLTINSPKRFPEAPLTANSSLNCVASASTVFASVDNYLAWKAFNNTSDAQSIYASSTLYNTTTGVYTGSESTTISGTVYLGEWLQIQLPYAINLVDYTIVSRPGFETIQSPNTWVIAGSNNGTTWTLLDTESNITNWSTTLRQQNFKVSNTATRYLYFRMICTVTGQTSNASRNVFVVGEWQLNGYRQFGIKYPIAPMTSDTTTFAGNALGCGTYRTTYSSVYDNTTDYQGWRAFNNTPLNYDAYHVGNALYYNGANNSYTGGTTTTISGSSYAGEWLQIELPHPIRLTRYSLIPRLTLSSQAAKTWKIAGSNDNSTWAEVDSETNITSWADNTANTFTTSNSIVAYKYYRLVVNQTVASVVFSLGEWMLYDDTTTTTNLYNKTPGLIEGLTWRIYGVDFGPNPNAFSVSSYINIGRTTNITNINFGTNGQYRVNGQDSYSVEWFGYFRAPVSGTYTFYTASDDWSFLWLGTSALVGYTITNAVVNNGNYQGITEASGSVYLIEGVYYPIRIQHGEGFVADDMQVSFTPPNGTRTYDGTGYYFSSTGGNQAYPAESAKIIKDITGINTDGVYYINVNGTSTPVYCLMNDHYDGGGWMMLMKATRGTTFNYNSTYWTRINILNPTQTNRNDGDAKFDTFNYMPVKDIMGIWPDIPSTSYTNLFGKNGGSLNLQDGWCWKIDNWCGTYTGVINQISTVAQNALRGAYALCRVRNNYYGAMVKLRRNGDNVEQDFFANLSGNLGTYYDAGGTSVMSWIGGMPLNIMNSNNWYTVMTAGAVASALAGTDPYVQSQLVAGTANTGGHWYYNSLSMSSYANFAFDAQIYWTGSGDFYSVGFGDTTANGNQGIRILFNFWSGYSNNGFSGTGIYILKNNVALAKSNTSPNGAGANAWFPIRVIYTASVTNTWQVFINGVSALTYSDSNAISWAASAGNSMSISAWSGGGLQISVWIRQLNLCTNFANVTTWYDQSGNGFHATQTTAANQPILTADSSGKFMIDSQNTGTQFLQMSTTGPVPLGSSNYTFLVRHGSLSSNNGTLIGGGTNVNNQANVLRAGSDGSVGYWNYWWFNDLGFGTNSRPAGNTAAVTWDGTTRRGYVVTNGGSTMTTVANSNTNTGVNVATAQQYLFRATIGDYLNGQMYHAYIFNIGLGTGDLSVLTNSQNYSESSSASRVDNQQIRMTALSGIQISRDAHPSSPYVFNGFSSNLFSTQTGASRHVLGGGVHLSAVWKVRWGLLFNNEADFLSIDAMSGVGLDNGYSNTPYSAGDAYWAAGTSRLNRNARIEFYGR